MDNSDHATKYREMAKDKHIAITNLRLFGIQDVTELRRLVAEDPHLNNTPLSRYDGMTIAFNAHNPQDRMTLSEGVCTYKQLLKDLADA